MNKVEHAKPTPDSGTKGKGYARDSQASPPANVSECYRCGGNHSAATCYCKQFLCPFCKKKEHLAKMCKQKAKAKKEEAKFVSESDTATIGEYSALFQVTSKKNKPYQVTSNVNGQPLLMEIDTGALVSVVGEGAFNNIREGKSTVELQETSTQLQTYMKEAIPVRGSVLVPVEHNGQSLTLPLIVTSGEGTPRLGRD